MHLHGRTIDDGLTWLMMASSLKPPVACDGEGAKHYTWRLQYPYVRLEDLHGPYLVSHAADPCKHDTQLHTHKSVAQ